MHKTIAALATAAVGAFALLAAPPASAQVARPGLAALAQAAPSDVIEVQRRRGRHRGGIGPWGGFALGFGAGALAGSALAAPYGYGYYGAPYAYGYPYYAAPYAYGGSAYAAAPAGSAHAYCAQRFRSYDPASGTYLGYDGERHPCP
jgi:hypothetical protein